MPATTREIKVQRQALEQGVRVSVEGELDHFSGARLSRELLEVHQEGQDYVEVDLHEVSYMDTSGIGVLVRAWKAFKSTGGRLRLIRVPGLLLTTIRIVGLGFLLD